MTVKPLPAVCGLPLETTVKVEAAAGVTLIAPLVPVIVRGDGVGRRQRLAAGGLQGVRAEKVCVPLSPATKW